MTEAQLVDMAREFLEGVLDRMGMRVEIELTENDDRHILDVQSDDVERLIGRRGQVVEALQHVVSKVVAKHRGQQRTKPIIVDAGGYRDKHIERLQGLAARMRDKALKAGDDVSLNPMNAHDRRIIHMHLAELGDVSTRSEGEGEERHIIVIPDSSESGAEAVQAE